MKENKSSIFVKKSIFGCYEYTRPKNKLLTKSIFANPKNGAR
jgi:hypothetical protein